MAYVDDEVWQCREAAVMVAAMRSQGMERFVEVDDPQNASGVDGLRTALRSWGEGLREVAYEILSTLVCVVDPGDDHLVWIQIDAVEPSYRMTLMPVCLNKE